MGSGASNISQNFIRLARRAGPRWRPRGRCNAFPHPFDHSLAAVLWPSSPCRYFTRMYARITACIQRGVHSFVCQTVRWRCVSMKSDSTSTPTRQHRRRRGTATTLGDRWLGATWPRWRTVLVHRRRTRCIQCRSITAQRRTLLLLLLLDLGRWSTSSRAWRHVDSPPIQVRYNFDLILYLL